MGNSPSTLNYGNLAVNEQGELFTGDSSNAPHKQATQTSLDSVSTVVNALVSGTTPAGNASKLGGALPSAYATAAQGALADTAIQPDDLIAANVSIADAGGYFTATNVEDALQQLAVANVRSTDIHVTGLYFGYVHYSKEVDFGAMPNATAKSVAHGLPAGAVIDYLGGVARSSTTALPIPYCSPDGLIYNMQISADATNVTIKSGTDRSSFSGKVTILFTVP